MFMLTVGFPNSFKDHIHITITSQMMIDFWEWKLEWSPQIRPDIMFITKDSILKILS